MVQTSVLSRLGQQSMTGFSLWPQEALIQALRPLYQHPPVPKYRRIRVWIATRKAVPSITVLWTAVQSLAVNRSLRCSKRVLKTLDVRLESIGVPGLQPASLQVRD